MFIIGCGQVICGDDDDVDYGVGVVVDNDDNRDFMKG